MLATSFSITGANPIYRSGLLHLLESAVPPPEEDRAAPSRSMQVLVTNGRPSPADLRLLIRRISPNRCTLVVGDSVSRAVLDRLLAAGADGYLLRDAGPDKLHRAIGSVLRGNVFVDPDLESPSLPATRPTDPLTKRERQVLRLIVAEHTTAEIAEKLYISRCTAETHRSHILQKLGVRNTAGIVREAIRQELCAF